MGGLATEIVVCKLASASPPELLSSSRVGGRTSIVVPLFKSGSDVVAAPAFGRDCLLFNVAWTSMIVSLVFVSPFSVVWSLCANVPFVADVYVAGKLAIAMSGSLKMRRRHVSRRS